MTTAPRLAFLLILCVAPFSALLGQTFKAVYKAAGDTVLQTGASVRALSDGYAAAAYRQLQRAGNAATLRLMADSLFPGGTQGFNLGEALAALNVPTRLVWGRADRVASSSHAAMAPGFVAVHMLDGVGHVPQLEVPALAARLIAETVRSAGP